MARSRRPERLWTCRGELHETAHGGPYRDDHLGGHPGRLVGSLRTGAQPADRLRVARLHLHPRSPEWLASHRVPLPAANHLEQRADSAHPDALLVRRPGARSDPGVAPDRLKAVKGSSPHAPGPWHGLDPAWPSTWIEHAASLDSAYPQPDGERIVM